MTQNRQNKRIVSVETPPCVLPFRQFIDMLTDEEITQARKERPDLVFRVMADGEVVNQPSGPSIMDMDNPKGISVKGMVLPTNLEDLIDKL